MCLGIPGEIISIGEDGLAEVRIKGVVTKARIDLVPEAKVGDWVMLHTGFALQILDEKEANETLSLLEEAGLIV